MNSSTIRTLRNSFRQEKQHTLATPVSLVAPAEDKTVLFNVAGMQPLVPYLSGKQHPDGKRLYNIQKCIRTNDIEDIGDERHLSMFEMMGNRSLGDYFKKESLTRSREFLTSPDYLGLDPDKLGCSIFGGYEHDGQTIIPYDAPAEETLLALGMKSRHIKAIPMIHGEKCDNFRGPAGAIGPCGPCAEFHYDRGDDYGPDDRDIGVNDRFIEIRNNVFMEFYKDENATFTPLSQQNVDTGMGFERTAMVLQNTETIFETDIFADLIQHTQKATNTMYPPTSSDTHQPSDDHITKSYRIILDHLRSSVMLIADGVHPTNEGRGYVLRRLIRRAGFHLYQLHQNMTAIQRKEYIADMVGSVLGFFDGQYSCIQTNNDEQKNHITQHLVNEIEKFLTTIHKGKQQLQKIIAQSTNQTITGKDAFLLYDTFGFPLELTQEIAAEQGYEVDQAGFDQAMQHAIQKSKADSSNKFSRGVDRAKYIEGIAPTQFVGYDQLSLKNPTIIKQFQLEESADGESSQRVIIFDRTPFYATGGGQESDTGTMTLDDGTIYHITQVINYAGVYLHLIA